MRTRDTFSLDEAEGQLGRAQELLDQIPYLTLSAHTAEGWASACLERAGDAERRKRILQWIEHFRWTMMVWEILAGLGCIQDLSDVILDAHEEAQRQKGKGMEQFGKFNRCEGAIAGARGDAMVCLWRALNTLSAVSTHPQLASIKSDLARLESFAEGHDDIVQLDQILERTREAVRQCAGSVAGTSKCLRQ